MELIFTEFNNEADDLVRFLTTDTWDFHGVSNPEEESIRKNIEAAAYGSKDVKTFWMTKGQDKIGIIKINDLEDDAVTFDIRIRRSSRGKGYGKEAVQWMADYIFCNYPHVRRLLGYTRQDNHVMRMLFHQTGFLREAHYRNGWPCSDGRVFDAIGYSLIREDWINKTRTLFVWDDLTY